MELEYTALTLGLTDERFAGIQSLLAAYKLRLLPTLTGNDASQLLSSQMFRLLLVKQPLAFVVIAERNKGPFEEGGTAT